jgi:hypothetical protein
MRVRHRVGLSRAGWLRRQCACVDSALSVCSRVAPLRSASGWTPRGKSRRQPVPDSNAPKSEMMPAGRFEALPRPQLSRSVRQRRNAHHPDTAHTVGTLSGVHVRAVSSRRRGLSPRQCSADATISAVRRIATREPSGSNAQSTQRWIAPAESYVHPKSHRCLCRPPLAAALRLPNSCLSVRFRRPLVASARVGWSRPRWAALQCPDVWPTPAVALAGTGASASLLVQPGRPRIRWPELRSSTRPVAHQHFGHVRSCSGHCPMASADSLLPCLYLAADRVTLASLSVPLHPRKLARSTPPTVNTCGIAEGPVSISVRATPSAQQTVSGMGASAVSSAAQHAAPSFAFLALAWSRHASEFGGEQTSAQRES